MPTKYPEASVRRELGEAVIDPSCAPDLRGYGIGIITTATGRIPKNGSADQKETR